jgi:hypothetical protein
VNQQLSPKTILRNVKRQQVHDSSHGSAQCENYRITLKPKIDSNHNDESSKQLSKEDHSPMRAVRQNEQSFSPRSIRDPG